MPEDMHPEDIKAALRKRGLTISQLADENGVAKQTVGAAIRARVSSRAEKIIAQGLKMEPRDIWPSRYRDDGKRIMLRRLSPIPAQDRKKAGAEA